MKLYWAVILFFTCTFKSFGNISVPVYFIDSCGTIIDSASTFLNEADFSVDFSKRPNPIFHLFKKKQRKNKRVVAAILAFPFPFGIVGLHRIYLGTAPYVPVAYIGSLGGVFGILPFIDFCVLILDKNLDKYIHNKKIFMWVN
ncbi:MAG: NINE protein [Bacteroidia bacterium]